MRENVIISELTQLKRAVSVLFTRLERAELAAMWQYEAAGDVPHRPVCALRQGDHGPDVIEPECNCGVPQMKIMLAQMLELRSKDVEYRRKRAGLELHVVGPSGDEKKPLNGGVAEGPPQDPPVAPVPEVEPDSEPTAPNSQDPAASAI